MSSGIRTVLEMVGGWLRAYRNEVALDTKRSFEDPIKFRGGAFEPTGWLTISSGDRLTGDESDPVRLEKGFFGIRRNDDYPGQEAYEFALYLQDPGGTEDATMRCRLRVTHDGIEVNGQRVGSSRVTRFYSDDGRFCFNVQGDEGGKLVQYATHGSADETTWTAVAQWKGAL